MRQQIITQTGNGTSNAAIMDYYGLNPISLQVDVVSGTPTWTVQQTLSDPNDPSYTPVWFDHPDANMVSQTVGRQSNYSFLPAAIRIVIASGGGTVRLTILQPGIRNV